MQKYIFSDIFSFFSDTFKNQMYVTLELIYHFFSIFNSKGLEVHFNHIKISLFFSLYFDFIK